MKQNITPLDLMTTANRMWWLALESQAVMAMRLMGMGGLWNVTANENARMWAEKPQTFQKSATAATEAIAKGKRPVEVVNAALQPLDRKVSANRRRLAKRGPGIRR